MGSNTSNQNMSNQPWLNYSPWASTPTTPSCNPKDHNPSIRDTLISKILKPTTANNSGLVKKPQAYNPNLLGLPFTTNNNNPFGWF